MQSLPLDWGDSAGPGFPGERRVSLARVCDFNGHQASFQAEKGLRGGGLGEGGGVVVREVMKTIHLVTSLTEREFEVLDFYQTCLSWCCADLCIQSFSSLNNCECWWNSAELG